MLLVFKRWNSAPLGVCDGNIRDSILKNVMLIQNRMLEQRRGLTLMFASKDGEPFLNASSSSNELELCLDIF